MIRILLIRHGHTELLGKILYGRMPGVHLSDRGRQETVRLASALHKRHRISEIASSPMDRARETAELIAAGTNRSVVIDEELQELDFGEWTGKSFNELMQDERWKAYNRHRSVNGAPGGEFLVHVQVRAWNAVERVIARHKHESDAIIAVVTHGDVVRALLMLFLGMPLDHLHRFEVFTASVSEVLLSDAYPQVLMVNQTF
jgi:broad specificity phosphatase PhoE